MPCDNSARRSPAKRPDSSRNVHRRLNLPGLTCPDIRASNEKQRSTLVANRRNILIGSGAAVVAAAAGTSVSFLFGATGALAQQIDVAKLMAPAGGIVDHPLGPADAKVTLIEYLSPT